MESSASSLSHAQSVARRIASESPDIDANLPVWARRSNPIIRRQLGAHWRVFPPQPWPLFKWYVIFAGFVLLTIPYPFLFLFILTLLLAVFLLLPAVVYLYFQTLVYIIHDASQAVVDEFQNETFTLLRTTPFTAREILLSKVMAAIWRRMSDLDLVIMMAVPMVVSPTLIFYLWLWPPEEFYGTAQWLTVITYGATLIRLPFEMFMVASVAAMMGAITRLRNTAFSATVALMFFYFLLLSLARLLELSWQMQLVVDALLPVVLPILISIGAISLALRYVTRD